MIHALRTAIFDQFVDPVLLRLIGRSEHLLRHKDTVERLRHLYATCDIHEDAIIHPEAQIGNGSKDCSRISIGAYTEVRGILETFGEEGRIKVGQRCYIGDHTRIWSQSSIDIGSFVLISHLVDIHDTNQHPLDHLQRRQDERLMLEGRRNDRKLSNVISKSIVIENDAWICFKATIMKGVRVGEGAIVAAGSVVTKDVPAWTVVAGNPARPIRTLTQVDHDLADTIRSFDCCSSPNTFIES